MVKTIFGRQTWVGVVIENKMIGTLCNKYHIHILGLGLGLDLDRAKTTLPSLWGVIEIIKSAPIENGNVGWRYWKKDNDYWEWWQCRRYWKKYDV